MEFTPENLPRAPTGSLQNSLPVPSFFRGELLNFGGVLLKNGIRKVLGLTEGTITSCFS